MSEKELFQAFSYDPKTFRASHDFIDEHNLLTLVDLCLFGAPKLNILGNGNVALSGPKGCGKDHLAMQSAINHSAVMYKTQAFQNMNEMDLLGYPQTIGDRVQFSYGILPAACKFALANLKKIIYVLVDEFNLASPGVLPIMNPMTDATRAISIPFTGEVIKRPENLKLILTMNPWEQAGYAGTNQMNIAMLDRFDIIEVDYLSTREETKLLQQYNSDYNACRKWAEFAGKTRRAYVNAEITNIITTRKLIDYVQYIKVLPEREIVKLALAQFVTDEREKVLKFWGDENFH